jgi:putative transposase
MCIYKYTERLAAAGLEPSELNLQSAASEMREPAPGLDPGDNALAETINGLYKTEVIRRRSSWKTIDDVEMQTLNWVDWFNNRRLLEPIGNIPPAEAEDNYYAMMDSFKMAA